VEKRVVLFMVLSAAIMLSYVALQATFNPRPDPVAENVEPEAEKPPEKKADKKKDDDQPSDKPATPADSPEEEATKAEAKWLTLGSVDPDSPYRMLVTFSSRGAAIERIEMASPRYRDLDDRSGYLGHLALTPAKQGKGALVNIVGAGTPAALAVEASDAKTVGLEPGDVIIGFNDVYVATPDDLNVLLRETKANDDATIKVARGDKKLTFTLQLGRRPLEVIRPEMEGGEGPDPSMKVHPLSLLMTLAGPRGADLSNDALAANPLRTQNWEMNNTTRGKEPVVEFTYRLTSAQAEAMNLPGQVEVVRRYSLAKVADEERDDPTAMGYHVDCEFEIRNLTDSKIDVGYVLDGPNGLPLEGWWYTNKIGPSMFGGAGARDIVWRRHGRSRSFRSCSTIYKYAKANEDKPAESLLGGEETTPLDYIGVDAQYFSTVLIPDLNDQEIGSPIRTAVSMPAYGVENIEKVDQKRTNVTFRMTGALNPVPANGSFKQTMRLYAGPKVPDLLAKYDIDDVIEYGWFKVVSIPLAGLLHFLKHNVFFNYGLAIIALTVIVRGCMVPFSLKAAKNAKMMQDLQPEMKAIKEKYKGDMQKQSEAQSALFKKHNYSPLSGCLPMFLQLPIFLGLYRALATDIELRQASLIPGIEWASNLAGPDMLWRWKDYLPTFLAGEASGWLGPYLNVLPLVSVAFLVVHQKLFTPPATDEQTKMTQDMMKYMTLFMGVLFFKVPAGLCLYFITSSLWSICERVWLPKTKAKPGDTIEAKPVPLNPKPGSNGVKDPRSKRIKQKKK
jgi:YidC/Oxa1 family membrane protein insertase